MKEVEFGPVDATELRVKPNLRVLGPKLGKALGAVRAALAAGEFEELEGGGFRVDGHELERRRGARRALGQGGLGRRLRGRSHGRARHERSTRAALEGRVYDLIHTLN